MNNYINEITEKVIEIRRYLHKHPELAFEEKTTAKYICECLTEFGIDCKTGIAETGVCATVKGGNPGKTILLRADMDALPISEQADCEFPSENEGKMHACGHDAHVAVMLGCAYVVNKIKDKLCGNVKFVFQPAEEGAGGAERMIAEGVMENPTVDAAFAFHVTNLAKTGQILVKNGPVMASTDEFDIIINGKSGHGAAPNDSIDPIVCAASVITNLQNIVSRNVTPGDPSVVSITSVNGGSAYNIIPDSVHLKGTSRAVDPETRSLLLNRIDEILKGVTSAHGTTYEFSLKQQYPVTVNDGAFTDFVRNVAYEVLGKENVIEYDICPMIAEDFSYFAGLVPASYIKLGIQGNGKGNEGLHSSKFDIDEDALGYGIRLAANIVTEYLK